MQPHRTILLANHLQALGPSWSGLLITMRHPSLCWLCRRLSDFTAALGSQMPHTCCGPDARNYDLLVSNACYSHPWCRSIQPSNVPTSPPSDPMTTEFDPLVLVSSSHLSSPLPACSVSASSQLFFRFSHDDTQASSASSSSSSDPPSSNDDVDFEIAAAAAAAAAAALPPPTHSPNQMLHAAGPVFFRPQPQHHIPVHAAAKRRLSTLERGCESESAESAVAQKRSRYIGVTGDFLPRGPVNYTERRIAETELRKQFDRQRQKLVAESGSGPPCAVVVLWGMGGVGKSTLAAKWARARMAAQSSQSAASSSVAGRSCERPVVWFNADDIDQLLSQIAGFGRSPTVRRDLQIESQHAAVDDDEFNITAAMQWFTSPHNRGWLLVLDNVVHFSHVVRHIPNVGGDVLITSRHEPGSQQQHQQHAAAHDRTGVDARSWGQFHLEGMSVEEACALFNTITADRHNTADRDRQRVQQLVKDKLQCLPLAVEAAAYYLASHPLVAPALDSYVRQFDAALLRLDVDSRPDEVTEAIWVALSISLDRLNTSPPRAAAASERAYQQQERVRLLAVDILNRLVYVHPSNIPLAGLVDLMAAPRRPTAANTGNPPDMTSLSLCNTSVPDSAEPTTTASTSSSRSTSTSSAHFEDDVRHAVVMLHNSCLVTVEERRHTADGDHAEVSEQDETTDSEHRPTVQLSLHRLMQWTCWRRQVREHTDQESLAALLAYVVNDSLDQFPLAGFALRDEYLDTIIRTYRGRLDALQAERHSDSDNDSDSDRESERKDELAKVQQALGCCYARGAAAAAAASDRQAGGADKVAEWMKLAMESFEAGVQQVDSPTLHSELGNAHYLHNQLVPAVTNLHKAVELARRDIPREREWTDQSYFSPMERGQVERATQQLIDQLGVVRIRSSHYAQYLLARIQLNTGGHLPDGTSLGLGSEVEQFRQLARAQQRGRQSEVLNALADALE